MLADIDVERYARQIVLPEVGGRGQERLLASRVRVLGDGIAGRYAVELLRRAGVGQATAAATDVLVDLRLDRPASDAPSSCPLVRGRLCGTRVVLDVLPAGVAAPVEPSPAVGGASDALLDCTLRALGALAACEAAVAVLTPPAAARRITIEVGAGRAAAGALEVSA
ncbi:MAG TPA: hypothetical protein VNO26_12410 [Candidatus Limnocylindria bacterium]|nr:hypothetical protein [Candidatus Limnocylindria bacterium]